MTTEIVTFQRNVNAPSLADRPQLTSWPRDPRGAGARELAAHGAHHAYDYGQVIEEPETGIMLVEWALGEAVPNPGPAGERGGEEQGLCYCSGVEWGGLMLRRMCGFRVVRISNKIAVVCRGLRI